MPETTANVRAWFHRQRNALTALDDELAEERRQLKDKAFDEDREMTTEEVSRRQQIAATRATIARALVNLGMNSVTRLDNAPDLDNILDALGAVNQELGADLNHLATIERYAQKAADIIALLAQSATSLNQLRATLPK